MKMKWKDMGHFSDLSRAIIDENDDTVCIVGVKRRIATGWQPWPKGEANFRLILKAPELLEALEEIVALRLGWCSTGDIIKAHNQCKEIARTAIAAVKGENGDDIG